MPGSAAPHERHVHVEHVMGTVVSFDLRDLPAALAREAIASACRELHRIDETYSTYRASSAICRIDRGELALRDAPSEVRWVLDRCEELREETGGAFDARATGRLDPSALVKGWAIERASGLLRRAGAYDHCVNGGGDITTRGHAPPASGWRVGVQHPLDPSALAAVVALPVGGAVATSGRYERGDHIVAPATGAPADALLSVTITGPDLALADAYSTAAFAMGDAGLQWAAQLPGYEAMAILSDGAVLRTEGFPLAPDDVMRSTTAAPAAARPTLGSAA